MRAVPSPDQVTSTSPGTLETCVVFGEDRGYVCINGHQRNIQLYIAHPEQLTAISCLVYLFSSVMDTSVVSSPWLTLMLRLRVGVKLLSANMAKLSKATIVSFSQEISRDCIALKD